MALLSTLVGVIVRVGMLATVAPGSSLMSTLLPSMICRMMPVALVMPLLPEISMPGASPAVLESSLMTRMVLSESARPLMTVGVPLV